MKLTIVFLISFALTTWSSAQLRQRPDWQMGHDLEVPAGTVPRTKPTIADLHPAPPIPKAIAKANIVTIALLP